MSDFVDRLERELLAAGRRSRPQRLARCAGATIVVVWPAVLSIGVAGAVAAVILGSGSARRVAPSERRPAPVRQCWRPPRNVRDALAPSTDAAPSRALLSAVGVLRRGATAGDHISLRGLVYSPITAVYARYIRVVTDMAGERFALVPAQVCGRANGGLYPAAPPGVRVEAPPRDAIFVVMLAAPEPRALFDAGDSAAITTGQSLGQWWPEGDGSVIATVVPDGVSRVTLSFGAHHRNLSMSVDDNLAVHRPSPARTPLSSTWYGPDGRIIRRFSFPATTRPVRPANPPSQTP